MKQAVTLRVNGREREVTVRPADTLLDALRDGLGLTGARRGCETSFCGACTVLLDGQAIHSCCVLALGAYGSEITTIEGLADGPSLHPLQQAFVDGAALQCGYCTPGFILSSLALLGSNPSPTEAEIRQALTGNICRCTGYVNIVAAVLAAAERMRG
jgi:aerobic carbon-monoxide dehydrogenase small subunit